eukprot:CAMPEP_0175476408 /NCGR_PEP_ID=MMETSP0095-20121207/75916_1 /TAXON_ID=311494 /ORGANISM="Alexandrium monilatum, Strain CCMP3105" /LENGTH=71 /DNA_ID=CAMNT_0016778003 /DNA_START=21 /DNA_END=233 /DNA_ORIENTATION=+
MPSGIDAALGKLAGLEAAPKKKAVDPNKNKIGEPTVDLRAEGLEACKKRVADQEKKIAAAQQELAALPQTK